MPKTRTQIYLTGEQRRRLDEMGSRERKGLAELIREAVDHFLSASRPDREEVLRETAGSCPELEIPPRSEWEHREARSGA